MNLDRDLLLQAEDFAKAHNVSLTVAAEAVHAGRKLDELSADHQKNHPDLSPAQSTAAVIDTPEGADLYAKMHPRSRPKAVKVDPQVLYAARFGLRLALTPRLNEAFDDAGVPTGRHTVLAERVGPNCEKLTEAQIADVALHLLNRWLETQPLGETGIDFFDEGVDKT